MSTDTSVHAKICALRANPDGGKQRVRKGLV